MSRSPSPVASASASNDAASLPTGKGGKRGPRGGIYDPFPLKFHRMLDQIKEEGLDDVCSWLSHGRAFKVHQPKVFAATVMPRFFNQSKYTSFQRQLNLYGFSRCCRGRDSGAYHHPFFLRGKRSIAKNIVRTKIKGNGHKTMRLDHHAEPDFHAMPPVVEDAEESYTDASSLELQPSTSASSPVPSQPDRSAPSPTFSSEDIARATKTFAPSNASIAEVSRQVSISSGTDDSSSDFVNDLNESIFIHELAMGCTILCQLRRDTSM